MKKIILLAILLGVGLTALSEWPRTWRYTGEIYIPDAFTLREKRGFPFLTRERVEGGLAGGYTRHNPAAFVENFLFWFVSTAVILYLADSLQRRGFTTKKGA